MAGRTERQSSAGLRQQCALEAAVGSNFAVELLEFLRDQRAGQRIELRRGSLGTFEALEGLALGILGKVALRRALATIAETDTRLRGVDFNLLAVRAELQHSRAEELRLQAVRAAFAPTGG